MVLRLIEGFETKQVSTTKWDRIYNLSGAAGTIVPGRKAGSAVISSSFQMTSEEIVSPDSNTWIIGFGVRKPSATALGANSTVGIQMQNAAGEQCSLVLVDAGLGNYKLELRRDVTVIDTSTGAFQFGNHQSWIYFQLKVTVRPTTLGVYELRSYDYLGASTVEFSGSSVNLAHQAVDGADRIRISWVTDSGSTVEIDDIVVMDDTGAQNTDFMTRPAVVLGSLPTADGNQSDWLPSSGSDHFALVDDPANSTSDTDRVAAAGIGDIDLFDYADFAEILSSGTSVIGAQVISTAAMLASGARTLRVRVRESASEAFGDNFVVNDLIVRSFRQLFDQNPTGTPATWTKATLDAAEFGLEIQA